MLSDKFLHAADLHAAAMRLLSYQDTLTEQKQKGQCATGTGFRRKTHLYSLALFVLS